MGLHIQIAGCLRLVTQKEKAPFIVIHITLCFGLCLLIDGGFAVDFFEGKNPADVH